MGHDNVEVKPLSFMLDNSWYIKVDKGSMINLDGKVIFSSMDNNLFINMADRLIAPAALFKALTKEEFLNVEKEVIEYATENNLDHRKEGDFDVFLNISLAESQSFYKQTGKGVIKFDRRLEMTDSALSGLQEVFGTKVFELKD